MVTRPARQGRLKLALEEVLSMQVDTPLSRYSTASKAQSIVAGSHKSPRLHSRRSISVCFWDGMHIHNHTFRLFKQSNVMLVPGHAH